MPVIRNSSLISQFSMDVLVTMFEQIPVMLFIRQIVSFDLSYSQFDKFYSNMSLTVFMSNNFLLICSKLHFASLSSLIFRQLV